MPAGLASETKCVGLSLLKGLRVVLSDIMHKMVCLVEGYTLHQEFSQEFGE